MKDGEEEKGLDRKDGTVCFRLDEERKRRMILRGKEERRKRV